jgi:magnesium transporter
VTRKHRRRRTPTIRRTTPPGAPPGLISPSADHQKPIVSVIAYDAGDVVVRDRSSPDEACSFVGRHAVTWINVEGLGDAAVLERFGELLHLHRLALEDTANVHQRAKVDTFGDMLYIVLRMVAAACGSGDHCTTEQISIFVGANWVLSFQEGRPGDSFDRVRSRLREPTSKMRKLGSDYLAYSLLDAAIDNYYPVLEGYAERLDELEELVMEPVGRRLIDELHAVKSDLLVLRRAIWPLRDAMAYLAREQHERISDETRLYFRDCYDHVVQVVDLIETYRELTADLRDLYMSSLSNRINETMRILTIFSTLFIPLTFIAGVYGMNFDWEGGAKPLNMPELHWFFGYPLALAMMGATAAVMLIYFYRRGWILR